MASVHGASAGLLAAEHDDALAGDDNIRRLDGLLLALARQYRARKAEREQDLNGKLRKL